MCSFVCSTTWVYVRTCDDVFVSLLFVFFFGSLAALAGELFRNFSHWKRVALTHLRCPRNRNQMQEFAVTNTV